MTEQTRTTASMTSRAAGPAGAGVALVIGFVAVSLNSRVAFGQIGPLAPVSSFGSSTVTVLGVLPPALMGVCAPATRWARRHLGDDRTLVLASAVLLVGCLVRPFGLVGLLLGTAIVAAATALINVVIPVVVRTRFPASATGIMMGVYAVCMGVGSAVVAVMMVPIAHATGSWPPAIAVAIVPAALAAVAIGPQWRSSRPVVATAHARTDPPYRSALGWSLLCFFGIQTLLFYAVLAWLSTILVAGGTAVGTAGAAQSCFIVGVGIGGFVAPALAGRRGEHRPHILAVIAVCALGLTSVLLAHGAATIVAATVLGAGLGGGQSLPGVLYAHRGKTPDRIAALSTFAQTGGYLLAATGPVLLACLHALSGSWRVPVIVLMGLLAANAILAVRAGHDGRTAARGPASAVTNPS
ncbi:MFS transporter [Gordonia polyisoprenivorans]|uniref:MFS transporter n=1 Tax=Gordonia polyisoprenivorans TaxID=84595 RepID=UPI001AD75616|nr:MFS transporter [Gordonia polyisoprenivorans]QTI67958.1 MFS transporter [Gordonia polyisoprenivorans]